MALFDDDGGVIVRPTILNSAAHERLNAARAALRCFRDCTIADIAAWRSRDAQGQPLAEGAQPATVLVDRKIYPARTHLADFYCFLWACYFKENPADLTLAARYDAFSDQPPGQRRYVARRTDSYPPEGLSRLSDAAAIAALTGGHLLTPPFDELLTRIEPAPAPNIIYTLGYTGSTPATVESYVKRLGAVLVDVRKSANSRVPHWRGAALAAQLGDRYLYLPDFGNDNYQGDGPIQLHNAAIVVEDARVLLQTQPIILLCGCADHRTCHRTVTARYLAMWLNARVEHLPARESSRSRADRPILGLGVWAARRAMPGFWHPPAPRTARSPRTWAAATHLWRAGCWRRSSASSRSVRLRLSRSARRPESACKSPSTSSNSAAPTRPSGTTARGCSAK